jgi:aminomethyltransferase
MDSGEKGTKKTPLYQVHLDLGARMMEFEGWLMPEWYGGVIHEHQTVRQIAGLFDLSHMGRLAVRGPGAFAFLQRALTNDMSRVEVGRAQYSLMCRPDGGILDDLVYYRLPDHYLVVVNASNTANDFDWLLALRELWQARDVEIEDLTSTLSLVAIQGPKSPQILQRLTPAPLDNLKRYWFTTSEVAGLETIIARTGYTGEDGFELYVSSAEAVSLWERLFREGHPDGIVPAGLAARDTLRLEAAYVLYGQEIDLYTNPYTAGLGPVIKLQKGDFVGREALARMREDVKYKLTGIEMLDRAVPRKHYPIVQGEDIVGCVSSGSYSPSLDKDIGFGYVPVALTTPGTPVDIIVRDKRHHAQVVATPFVRHV